MLSQAIPLHRPGWPWICEVRVTCGVIMISLCHGWGWYPPQTPSYIPIMHIQSVWAIGMLSQGHVGAPLNHYTGQIGPRFGDSGSLEEWKACHNVMFWADIYLRPLHTYILDIYEVFCHWYAVLRACECTIIPLHWPSWPPILGFRFTCGVKMMP